MIARDEAERVTAMRMTLIAAAWLWTLAVMGSPGMAAESAVIRTDHVRLSLVSAQDGVAPGRMAALGLRFQLAPGWHIYWRNPGDAGLAPQLDTRVSSGAEAGPIGWPIPLRLREGPITTYGYTGAVLLPFTVRAGRGALTLDATVNWLVCERVCIPESGALHLHLPVGPAQPSAEAPLFAAAAARMPTPSPFAASVQGGTLTVLGAGISSRQVADAWFLPFTGTAPAADPVISAGRLQLAIGPGAPGPRAGVLVLRHWNGVEQGLTVTAPNLATPNLAAPALAAPPLTARPAAGAATSRWALLPLALLGGLLLNLMPCVFPVLAMKALALARASGAESAVVRGQALAYTAGVLASFAALAGLLAGLRLAGRPVGWGLQFQSPVFVTVTAWVLFLTGLNLSGLFHVGGRLAGVGQSLAARRGWVGSWFTGVLAVVVAAPCTAPFMGAAIAGALAAPAFWLFAILLAMGAGLALPTLVLALWPGLAALLPRPGGWMEVLRQVLAFPMYAATLWLIWVLSVQTGPAGVLAGGAGLLLCGFAAWAFGMGQRARLDARPGAARISHAAALVALVGALTLLPGLRRSAFSAAARSPSLDSAAFSSSRLARLRAAGTPVFVDMSAAWCLSCLVNERVALQSARVRRLFAQHGIVTLTGDWTRQDPAITAYLHQFGRDGVPLYVWYAPNARPVMLPQILTPGVVIQAIGAANAPPGDQGAGRG